MPKGINQTPAANVKHVPILRFYGLTTGTPSSTNMTVSNFQSLVSWLFSQGYVPQFLSDYTRWMRGEIDLPRKSCVLVFYGGYIEHYAVAFPYLQSLGFKFNLMVPGSSVQGEAYVESGLYYTLSDLETMVGSGLCEPHSEGFHLRSTYNGGTVATRQLPTAAQVNLKWGGWAELMDDIWSYAPLIGTNASGAAIQSTYTFMCAPRGYRPGALNPTQVVAAYLIVDHLSSQGTPYAANVSIGIKRDQDSSYTIIKSSWTPNWSAASQVVTLDTPFTLYAGTKYDLQFTTLNASGGAPGELVSLGCRTAGAEPVSLDALTTFRIRPPAPPQLQQVPIGSGYTLPQRRYYVKWTELGPNGETIGSDEATILLNANYVLQILTELGTILPGCTQFNVYVGTSSGEEVQQYANGGDQGSPAGPSNFYPAHGSGILGWTEGNHGINSSGNAPPTNPAVLAPPAAPTLSTVYGGELEDRYYNVVLTYINPAGPAPYGAGAGESQPSIEVSNFHVPAGYLLQVASPAAESNATGWNLYVSQGAEVAIGNAAQLEEGLQNSSPIPIGLSWTEPETGLVAGVGFPVLPTALAPVPTIVETDSSIAPDSGQQIGGDIYLLESLAVETVAQMQTRVLADAQENLDFLAPYLR